MGLSLNCFNFEVSPKYAIFAVKYTAMNLDSISQRYRLLGLAVAAALTPIPANSQAFGTAGDLDPLCPGYIMRATRMLQTGNPLGTIGQIDLTSMDFEFLSDMEKAEWLAAKGAALFDRGDADCLKTLLSLASEFPESPKAVPAILTAGDWHWFHSEWHDALELYSRVDIKSLPDAERRLYTYRKALAYLKCGMPENATPLLSTLVGTEGYDTAARYYLAYAAYLNADYDTAYSEMKRIAEEISGTTSTSRSGRGQRLARAEHTYISDGIEPLYYMAQIEYLRGEYQKVIDHTATLMAKRPVDELLPEIHRIAGLSLFKTGDIDNARAHLTEYVGATDSPNDDAVYALGAIQYADNDLAASAKKMQTLTDRNNVLAQGAYLYLGQIAEREGDMNAAAIAFGKAAGMAFDRKVAETAAYNRIVAISKGGGTPFASSISMLEDFLAKYPDSPYASEVEESLATAYFHENDFQKALAAINRVKNTSDATLATKQKILYRYGISDISAGKPANAIKHLQEAAAMTSTDPALANDARVWLGEALYRTEDYKGAVSAYETALKSTLSASNKRMARYGLAYSEFQRGDWKKAQKDFAMIADDTSAPESMRSDALIRDADCLHYLGRHKDAGTKYLAASRAGGPDADYAAFRHAVVAGLTDGTDAKMRELDIFLENRRNSPWTPQVLLEAGRTMAALERPDKAAPYLERLRRDYPRDAKSREGAMSLALAYMKQGKQREAQDAYRDIIRTWPTSEEAALANDDMKRLTAADGTLQEYAEFLSTIKGAPQINPDEMDTFTFEAAETAYAEDPANTHLLEKYVERYPDGRWLSNALMDLAEAADRAGNSEKALSWLERLLSARGDSQQAPAALFLQAEILEDSEEKDKALESYRALATRGSTDFAAESTAGIMRCTSDARERTEYARRLLAMGGVADTDAEDARFYEASGLLHSGDAEAGQRSLRELAKNPDTLSGAKAAVELGEWQLAQGNTKDALATLEKFTDAGSVHAYWLARGFIDLAKAYHAEGNDYLASEYLKSLRDNYPGNEPDILEAIESGISEYNTKH